MWERREVVSKQVQEVYQAQISHCCYYIFAAVCLIIAIAI